MSVEPITRVSAEQARLLRGTTDWERVRAMSEQDIARAAAEDPDAAPSTGSSWRDARIAYPRLCPLIEPV